MPRQSRIVIPGCPHHVTQRGNQRRQLFFADADYQLYLTLLGDHCRRFGVRVHGYCLMSNHVHLVPTPAAEDALARAVGLVNQRYSQLLNLRTGQTGHCWQNRFFSCPLDESYSVRTLRYVERNPARAGLVTVPWDYPWSSARAHCTGDDPTGLLDLMGWASAWPGTTWQDFIALPEAPGEVDLFRLATTVGRPLGSETFVTEVEALTGRCFHPKAVGRPRNEPDGREEK